MANSVEMLSGRRKKDYAAETAAQALETQAEVMGIDSTAVEGEPGAELDPEDVDSEELAAVAACACLSPQGRSAPCSPPAPVAHSRLLPTREYPIEDDEPF